MMAVTAFALAVMVVLFLGGCTVRSAQVSVRTALTGADEAVAAADRITRPYAEDARDEALAEVEAGCEPPAPCPGARARYLALVEPWTQVARAYRGVHEAILIADEGVEAWIASGNLPAGWGQLCTAIGEGVERLLAFLETVLGEDVPSVLAPVPAMVTGACSLAEPWIGGE